eukprot:CAMPEP_0119119328 /NCGR_PEP_ID=MMETSP1310-20130426/861_1 /TAXON_ID=464262 /ORGANISM="Genus nov. species nov., Strain RCC2339" /LENGTH=536 /DNA_ID=CAMNT_0007108755 /DNA_START=272 /DNA_END=1882 /DNA_ORIENTATION=+
MDSYFMNFGLRAVPIRPYQNIPWDSHLTRLEHFPMLLRAATTILCTLDLKRRLESGTYPVEMQGKGKGAKEVCMEMFGRFFNSCRVPFSGEDKIVTYHPSARSEPLDHFYVCCSGHFYGVDVVGEGGAVLGLPGLVELLQTIVEDAAERPQAWGRKGTGLLSCQDRETWAEDSAYLQRLSPENADILQFLYSSAFGVCLEPSSFPMTLDAMDVQIWHNHGANRWFDKPIQWVAFGNGYGGLHGEHSGMDGTVSGNVISDICPRIDNGLLGLTIPTYDAKGSGTTQQWSRLDFKLDDHLLDRLRSADAVLQNEIGKVSISADIFSEFGAAAVKKLRASPDAFCQVAMQMTIFRLERDMVPQYESASTRTFQHGRTETIRSVTSESRAAAEAFYLHKTSIAEKNAKLRKALAEHSAVSRRAVSGEGIDRHLLGLRMIHAEKYPGKPLPKVFQHPAFGYSCNWRMSTSQLGNQYYQAGYGAVVDDGLGAAYSYTNNHFQFKVSSRHLTPVSPKVFLKALRETLLLMRHVLASGQPTAKL